MSTIHAYYTSLIANGTSKESARRKAARQYHPDKGGDSKAFQEFMQAFVSTVSSEKLKDEEYFEHIRLEDEKRRLKYEKREKQMREEDERFRLQNAARQEEQKEKRRLARQRAADKKRQKKEAAANEAPTASPTITASPDAAAVLSAAVVHNPNWAPFGPGTSRYCSRILTPEYENRLLTWCRDEVRFQIYQCTTMKRIKGGVPRLNAPKAEFYLLGSDGRRPYYKWTQMNDFNHAGYPMPPILAKLCEALNDHFHLTGDDRLNHCLIICNEQSGEGPNAHCAPPHADKIQKGFFVDLSLGYARTMKLIDAQSEKEVASQALGSGSLAYITTDDNGRLVQGSERGMKGTRYKHKVPVDPHQPRDQPRFSIVFRPITDHPNRAKCGEHLANVDEFKATRVQPGGDLWREYVPLCRGGNGAEPARTTAPTAVDSSDEEEANAASAAAASSVAHGRGRDGSAVRPTTSTAAHKESNGPVEVEMSDVEETGGGESAVESPPVELAAVDPTTESAQVMHPSCPAHTHMRSARGATAVVLETTPQGVVAIAHRATTAARAFSLSPLSHPIVHLSCTHHRACGHFASIDSPPSACDRWSSLTLGVAVALPSDSPSWEPSSPSTTPRRSSTRAFRWWPTSLVARASMWRPSWAWKTTAGIRRWSSAP